MLISQMTAIAFELIKLHKIRIKKHSIQGITLNAKQINPANFDANLLFETIPGFKEKLEEINTVAPQLLHLSGKEFLQLLRDAIDADTEKASRELIENSGSICLDVGFDESKSQLDNLRFFQDVKDGSFYAYNILEKQPLQIKWQVFDTQVANLPKEIRPAVYAKIETVSTIYHPALPPGPFKVTPKIKSIYDVSTSQALNTYVPPLWKSMKVEPRLCPKIDFIMNFLFLGKECVEHVYRWIRTLVWDHDKLLPIMVLHSPGGTGKGVLFDGVVAALVGQHNFGKPPSGQGGRFDKYIAMSNAVYSSEALLTEERFNRLKDLYDMKSNFEAKGVEIGRSQRIATRFILSSNDSSNLYMSYDARKFTVPDVTRGPQLNQFMPEEDIDYLSKIGERHEDVAQFGYWLKDNFKPLKITEVWHGHDFKVLCERALAEWFKVFRSLLTRRKEFTYEEFYDAFRQRNKPGIATIERTLQMYELAKRKKICEIVPSIDGTSDGYLYKSLIYGVTND